MQITKNSKGFSKQIQNMFSAIAPRYDFLNKLLSFGLDSYWRKRAIKKLNPQPGQTILDLATGTADIAIEIAREISPKTAKIIGVDFSPEMLVYGNKKIKAAKFEETIELLEGKAESLEFKDHTFDSLAVAFGVRNFSDLEKGLLEMYRVLKPNGSAVILEFSFPKSLFLKRIYKFYFNKVLPLIGNLISRHNEAYTYLPQSVGQFPSGSELINILEKIGFKKANSRQLTFGIVTMYNAIK